MSSHGDTMNTPDPSHAPENDSIYEGLVVDNDSRWAFGTDFEDPLARVDTTVPKGVDGHELAVYCLMRADDALVMSHRLSEWCSNAPDLEEDIALANIALDLLGQARLLLARGPPGPRAPPVRRPRAARGIAGAGRGRAGVLPRGDRLPQRPAGRGAERRLRAHG